MLIEHPTLGVRTTAAAFVYKALLLFFFLG